mgnify:CR=1 FL=1
MEETTTDIVKTESKFMSFVKRNAAQIAIIGFAGAAYVTQALIAEKYQKQRTDGYTDFLNEGTKQLGDALNKQTVGFIDAVNVSLGNTKPE